MKRLTPAQQRKRAERIARRAQERPQREAAKRDLEVLKLEARRVRDFEVVSPDMSGLEILALLATIRSRGRRTRNADSKHGLGP